MGNSIIGSTSFSAPFGSFNVFVGYTSSSAPVPNVGVLTPASALGVAIEALGVIASGSSNSVILVAPPGTSQTFFQELSIATTGGTLNLYESAATFVLNTSGGGAGGNIPTWVWASQNPTLTAATVTFSSTSGSMTYPTTPTGQGDITDPYAWIDSSGNIPPAQFQNVPNAVNYPLNGDGRYWFTTNAEAPLATTGVPTAPIYFIGSESFVTDTASLQWTITSTANDGSSLYLAYRTSASGNYVSTLIAPSAGSYQTSGLLSGQVLATLTSGTAIDLAVYSSGGVASTAATSWEVAVAITRNVNESIPFDYPNPFNPMSYNGACTDEVVPTDTLGDLQYRLLVRLGFAVQASNPPPGMAALCQDFLQSAQTYLYRRYMQLHTKRMFRWKINPGQRFYSLKDNDEDVLCNYTMDPLKKIEWAGIQDTRNVWYPLIQGIPPQLYTMIDKPWRPARYDIKQSIEVYPTPDQTYWLWMRGHFGLRRFTQPTDLTTLDSELVFLWALGNAKAHYGQPDAQNIVAEANAYRAELIAGTHQTAHYIPGTIAVPPAVRPTLIQFSNEQSG